MKEKRLNIRVDENLIQEINTIAQIESKKTGIKMSQSNIIRKAIKEYIDKNK